MTRRRQVRSRLCPCLCLPIQHPRPLRQMLHLRQLLHRRTRDVLITAVIQIAITTIHVPHVRTVSHLRRGVARQALIKTYVVKETKNHDHITVHSILPSKLRLPAKIDINNIHSRGLARPHNVVVVSPRNEQCAQTSCATSTNSDRLTPTRDMRKCLPNPKMT